MVDTSASLASFISLFLSLSRYSISVEYTSTGYISRSTVNWQLATGNWSTPSCQRQPATTSVMSSYTLHNKPTTQTQPNHHVHPSESNSLASLMILIPIPKDEQEASSHTRESRLPDRPFGPIHNSTSPPSFFFPSAVAPGYLPGICLSYWRSCALAFIRNAS